MKIPYKCLSRVDLLLRDETVRYLKESGCQTVWVGAESGSQKILDAMDKGTTVEEIHEATHLLRRHGIRVGFFLQFGYPGETRNDIDLTLAMVRECQPDEIGISVSYPLPGTIFYDRVREQLSAKQNWETSDDFDPMFAAAYSREYYRRLHSVVHRQFRIWRGARALRSLQRNPFALDGRMVRSVASMAWQMLMLPASVWMLRHVEKPRSYE